MTEELDFAVKTSPALIFQLIEVLVRHMKNF